MLHRLRKHVPRFSISSLLLLTTAVAMGFAVSQSPQVDQAQTWQLFDPAYRGASEKLICTGSLLIAFEFLRQSWFLWSLRSKVQSKYRFSILWALFQRVAVSSAILLLALLRLLMIQNILVRVEDEGFNHIYGTLWPDIMLDAFLILAIRMLLVRKEVIQTAGSRWIQNLIITVGLIGALTYIVIDRATVLAFVHMAVDSVESGHASSFQRPNVYPSHTAESFRSFWQAATAAAGVLLAVTILLVCPRITSTRAKYALCAVFFGVIAINAYYVFWFNTHEFHRISPELASARLASQWGKWLAGSLLCVGMALYLGAKLAAQATRLPALADQLPQTSELTIVGAIVIAMAAVWHWIWVFRQLLESAGWFYGWGTFRDSVRSIGSSLLYPEHMIPLALFISATSLVWQMFRDPQAAPKLLPLEPWRLTGYTIAWLLLILVAIPTFAIFGFCYWIGPCVL